MIGFTVTIIKLSISMHSSRMPTARLLPVSISMHWGGCLLWGCLLLGGVCSHGVSAPRGGVFRSRRVGVSAEGEGCLSLPPVNRMTDRCKNITLPQLRCGR